MVVCLTHFPQNVMAGVVRVIRVIRGGVLGVLGIALIRIARNWSRVHVGPVTEAAARIARHRRWDTCAANRATSTGMTKPLAVPAVWANSKP